MAGDHAAWIKQMAQLFSGSNSGGGTATLTKEVAPGVGSKEGDGPKRAAPADDEEEEDDASEPTGKGAPSGKGGGAPAVGGGGAPAGGGGGGGGGSAASGSKGGGGGAPASGAGDKAKSDGASKGEPAAGGGGAAAADAPSGKADSGGKGGAPAAPAPKASGDYSSAKDASHGAEEYLKEFETVTGKLKSAEEELKKLFGEAEAGKKAIATAEQAAGEAEKAIPPAPKVAAPKGDNPPAQYDSSIQIKGDTLKVQQEAQAKIDAVGEQRDATQEQSSKIENAHKLAASSLEKFKSLKIDAQVYSEGAVKAANDAQALAAESKQKAEQAEKDKSADAEKLKTAAKEDEQFVKTAQGAASKAQAAAKQIDTAVKNAETTVQNLEKMEQEARAADDARKQQATNANQKLQPHMEAAQKAETQEQECKEKLSAEDAEAVLLKRYQSLGGDDELRKALEEEDKAFETAGEKYRAEIKKWHDDTVRQLDDFKQELEPALKRSELDTPKWDEWIKREEPIGQKVTADLNALGDKLKTERVKELGQEIKQTTDEIADIKRWNAEDQEVLEAMKVAKHALDERYRSADAELSTGEKYITDSRTELNNELEMQNMSLEQKVDFLQFRPKIVRDRYQKRMEDQIARLVRENADDMKAQITKFESAVESYVSDPINWKPMQDKIAEFQKMSLEELQKDEDPQGLGYKYDQAGGDEALLQKRMNEWKLTMQDADTLEKQQATDQQKRSEQMREALDRAQQRENESREVTKATKMLQEQQQKRLEELKKKESSAAGLTSQERAESKLLDRSLKDLKTKVDNLVGAEVMRNFGKHTSEALVEAQRKLADAKRANYQKLIPKPTSEDVQKMPIKAKYKELTGLDE